MLDHKLATFLSNCKAKSENLANEIDEIITKNTELKSLVDTQEAENFLLFEKKSKRQLQLEQLKEIHKALKMDVEETQERLAKAKKDFCDITKAHQMQKSNIKISESELTTMEKNLNINKQERHKGYKLTLETLDKKIENLKKNIIKKSEINTATRLELLEQKLRDSQRAMSIKEQNRNYF
jgi:chromosome segregation ATPase